MTDAEEFWAEKIREFWREYEGREITEDEIWREIEEERILRRKPRFDTPKSP